MTSPVAVYGLSYDGTDLQAADLSMFFWIVKGLWTPPTVRGTDTIIPALAGRAEGLRLNDYLEIELLGQITADPDILTSHARHESFEQNAQTFRTLFAPSRTTADLVVTLGGTTQKRISARPLNWTWDERVPGLHARVSLEMQGLDDWADEGS